MSTGSTFAERVEHFRALLEKEQNERVERIHPILAEGAKALGRRGYVEVEALGGNRKFVKLVYNRASAPQDNNTSVAYFIEVETEKIFGARSWKAYNPARLYGTLSTVDEWYWGEYYGVSKQGANSLVPKDERRTRV